MHTKVEIDRYLSFGLPPPAEDRLRVHLGGCTCCRSYYDHQILLFRALAGTRTEPAPGELDRLVGRVMRTVGLAAISQPTSGPGRWFERWLWVPARAAAVAAVVLLGLVTIGWWLSSGAWAPGPVAQVAMARGLTIGDQPVDPARVLGYELRIGERFAVGSKGAAELTLARGGTLKLFPGTSGLLVEGGDRLELQQGRVWCQIEPDRRGFGVHTPSARVEVVGTSFLVGLTASGATEVQVESGVVEVQDPQGSGRVQVQAGQTTRVAPGKAPDAARRIRRAGRSLDSEWDRILQGLEAAIEEFKDLFR